MVEKIWAVFSRTRGRSERQQSTPTRSPGVAFFGSKCVQCSLLSCPTLKTQSPAVKTDSLALKTEGLATGSNPVRNGHKAQEHNRKAWRGLRGRNCGMKLMDGNFLLLLPLLWRESSENVGSFGGAGPGNHALPTTYFSGVR